MAALEEEKFVFTAGIKKWIIIVGITGIVLFALGVFSAMSGSGHHEAAGAEHHGAAEISKSMVASAEVAAEPTQEHEAAAAGGEHHGSPTWLKRIYASLWHNNIFFTGLGIIGLFFVAIQYAAQAGWSAPIKRIPLAMGAWIPIAGILMLVLYFIVHEDVFHWTHAGLYEVGGKDFDEIIVGKSAMWYWPLAGGTFPIFFIVRMVLFFGLWYMFFVWIRKEMLEEDRVGGVANWFKARKLSAVFLIVFAVSSSVGAWDWVMSIDPHWFSTMLGWYVFASWWVTGLAVITLIVAVLKDAGYLKSVNANHLHDLGKFIFAFSIFWTYIWFSQFMLIYYANIPEETVYFITRMKTAPFSWIFFANLILNFVLPFLLFMTRDAKRHLSTLKVVCPIVIIGHWFDFFNMVTPGVMKTEGAFGVLEVGLFLIFTAAFLFVVLNALAKYPLVAKNDPMMGEAMNHHI
jgi:hypothetical protein